MQIKKLNTSVLVDDSAMRIYVASPDRDGKYPGVILYSDIYQLGGPIIRLADHLAGYGFVVAAPEIYHRLLSLGTVIEPNDLGRIQGNEAARKTNVSEFDKDAGAMLEFLRSREDVDPHRLATIGFCIGGHLSFRAAFNQQIKATVCVYPTGIHNGKLGREKADSLTRVKEITGGLLLIFGTLDPHIPEDGREAIVSLLQENGINHKVLQYRANHTFMRDDGYRFDPVATDLAWKEITSFLNGILG
ncbi:MAG: hypothetical protein N5P05_004087 (plasmid) [Chroococcopsis gigantea SAG 12.99]|nr:hypothetical protein [Chroococcopsis gigantea SAG 12.99]